LNLRTLEPSWPKALSGAELRARFPGRPLARFLSGRRRVAVVVPDQTRPCQARRLLEMMAPLLDGKSVTVVYGQRAPPEDGGVQAEELLGRRALGRWRVVQHDPDDPACVSLGWSPSVTR